MKNCGCGKSFKSMIAIKRHWLADHSAFMAPATRTRLERELATYKKKKVTK